MRLLSPIRIFFFALLFICIPTILSAQTPGAETCGTVASTITPSASCTPILYNIKNAVSEGVAGACARAAEAFDRWVGVRPSATATAVTIKLSGVGGGREPVYSNTQVESI